MSLAIVFKGTEGLVLAVDSRVTLTVPIPVPPGTPPVFVPSTFDNATKFLQVNGQKYIGAVTYGLGAIGQQEPRTAHSFIPEFEAELKKDEGSRLSVKTFAERLGQFFLNKWTEHGMPEKVDPSQVMVFYVAGFDEGEPYGRVYELHIPSAPTPKEWHVGAFGVIWGGQCEFVQRLISGFDPQLFEITKDFLQLTDEKKNELQAHIISKIQASIPFPFLPLQDCVNLAILLIRATMTIQTFTVGLRGVGGAIDVATITRTAGLQMIQSKSITGEVVK